MLTFVDATHTHSGVLEPPLSKSDAHRAWVVAALRNLPPPVHPSISLPHDVVVLQRGLDALAGPATTSAPVDCEDAGAPFRFLLALAATRPGRSTMFTGTPRLAQRPHAPLVRALVNATGGQCQVETGPAGGWPWRVRGAALTAPLVLEDGSSSQWASALVLAAAAATAQTGGSHEVVWPAPLASWGYLELTLHWLERGGFGLRAHSGGVTVSGPLGPAQLPPVPADWSSLGYLLCMAWKTRAGVQGVDLQAAHPDAVVVRHLQRLGLRVRPTPQQPPLAHVEGCARGGLVVDATGAPDLVPTLWALACVLDAPSVFTGTHALLVKESNRQAFLLQLAAQAGASVTVGADALSVRPGRVPRQMVIDTESDHRRSMAAVTLAVLAGTRVALRGPPAVAKSYPDFLLQVQRLGVAVQS